jgi:hypothetical protein
MHLVAALCLFMGTSSINLGLLGRKRNIEIEDDCKIKRQTNLDRRCSRPIANVCHYSREYLMIYKSTRLSYSSHVSKLCFLLSLPVCRRSSLLEGG